MTDLMRHYIPVCVQLLIASIVGAVVLVIQVESLSAWLSGSLLATVCYAWFVFRAIASNKIRSSEWVVALASRGLMEKYILAASGFACIFAVIKPHNPLLVFVGFSLMTVIQWVVNFKIKAQNPV